MASDEYYKDDYMNIVSRFVRLISRLRHPVSLPEDVAKDLGFSVSNFLSFGDLVQQLTYASKTQTKLYRFMPRAQADDVFKTALRKEKFSHNSLYSYYFNEGWVEFFLQFDEQSRLRRLYIQHKHIKDKKEIPLG